MNGKHTLYMDQYGSKYHCHYIYELKTKHYLSGKMSKMYVDGKDGKRYHVGYVVGNIWLSAYQPFRELAI